MPLVFKGQTQRNEIFTNTTLRSPNTQKWDINSTWKFVFVPRNVSWKRACSCLKSTDFQKGSKERGCENPRIIEWFGLEGTLKIIEFQAPWQGQGHLPGAQGPGCPRTHPAWPWILPGVGKCSTSSLWVSASTASLGNLLLYLSALRANNFFFISKLSLPSLGYSLPVKQFRVSLR